MMTMTDLSVALEGRRALLETIKDMQKMVDGIDNSIKEEMVNAGVEELKVNNITVRYKKIVSQRLDTNRLKGAMSPEVWRGFCKTSEAMRFTVTEGDTVQ